MHKTNCLYPNKTEKGGCKVCGQQNVFGSMTHHDLFDFLDALHQSLGKGWLGAKGQSLNAQMKLQHGIFQSSIFPMCWGPPSWSTP